MPRNVYHEINLHIVWRTKGDVPALVDPVENHCHRFITHRCRAEGGVTLHAIGGMPDHVHLAVSVPPTLTVAEWVGKLKGASAYYINQEICNRKVLEWQTGYGVLSFGTKDLPWVVQYVRTQKEHHASGSGYDRLERIIAEERPLSSEAR